MDQENKGSNWQTKVQLESNHKVVCVCVHVCVKVFKNNGNTYINGTCIFYYNTVYTHLIRVATPPTFGGTSQYFYFSVLCQAIMLAGMPAVPLFPFNLKMHHEMPHKWDICPVKLHLNMPFAEKNSKKFLRREHSYSSLDIQWLSPHFRTSAPQSSHL